MIVYIGQLLLLMTRGRGRRTNNAFKIKLGLMSIFPLVLFYNSPTTQYAGYFFLYIMCILFLFFYVFYSKRK